MKRMLLLGLVLLAGCSPLTPSAQDVQQAVEDYYLFEVYQGENIGNVVVRCSIIMNIRWDREGNSNDGRVSFQFSGEHSGADKSTKFAGIPMNSRGSSWEIPKNANLKNLPCKAITVSQGAENG